MKIYIDTDFKCHLKNNGTMVEINVDYFNGKCDTFIEGYRFIPSGQVWTRKDGVAFEGEMAAPWKSYDELDQAQRKYEQELAEAARILLGGN